jgi:uncharacterized membrane protein YfcA
MGGGRLGKGKREGRVAPSLVAGIIVAAAPAKAPDKIMRRSTVIRPPLIQMPSENKSRTKPRHPGMSLLSAHRYFHLVPDFPYCQWLQPAIANSTRGSRPQPVSGKMLHRFRFEQRPAGSGGGAHAMLLSIILLPLAIAAATFTILLGKRCWAAGETKPRLIAILLGAVTNFFDTLGIGSFAPTMAWMRLQRLVPDRLIPSTMVAGHSLPVLMQSAIFLAMLGVQVDPPLLVCSIIAMVIGGQIGAPLARHAPIRAVQAMVAVALIIAAGFYIAANLGLTPHAQPLPHSSSYQLMVAVALHLLLGILLNFGVGNYAPTLLVFSLIGIDPKLAFPVMSSACAYCIITSGIRVLREDGLDLRMISGIAIGGVPAVLLAALVVKAMPVTVLRWLVVAVVLYASAMLWNSVLRGPRFDRTAGRETG